MSVHCDIILRWGATPEQLTVLGAALWRWCSRAAGAAGVYPRLDDQPLADLIAGRLPASGRILRRADRRGVHFVVRDEASPDRRAAIASLRREIPDEGIEDILVDGKSWDPPA